MSKQIRISTENTEAIEVALEAIQRRARVNLYSGADVIDRAERAEELLDALGIPRAARAGAAYLFHAKGPWANAYTYGQGATQVEIVRRGSAWYLTSVTRITVYPQRPALARLTLTEKQDALAIVCLRRTYSVVATSITAVPNPMPNQPILRLASNRVPPVPPT